MAAYTTFVYSQNMNSTFDAMKSPQKKTSSAQIQIDKHFWVGIDIPLCPIVIPKQKLKNFEQKLWVIVTNQLEFN